MVLTNINAEIMGEKNIRFETLFSNLDLLSFMY